LGSHDAREFTKRLTNVSSRHARAGVKGLHPAGDCVMIRV
jgi:hypothetical protein